MSWTPQASDRRSDPATAVAAWTPAPGGDTSTVLLEPAALPTPARHHWVNTLVGLLDGAFYLSPEEQYAVTGILSKLLGALRVPGRAAPTQLPMPVIQELHAGYYSTGLDAALLSARPVRPVTPLDCVTSAEAWRCALETMVIDTYPDLSADERMLLAKVLSDVLAALGVPNRAPAYLPDAVLHSAREIDDYR